MTKHHARSIPIPIHTLASLALSVWLVGFSSSSWFVVPVFLLLFFDAIAKVSQEGKERQNATWNLEIKRSTYFCCKITEFKMRQNISFMFTMLLCWYVKELLVCTQKNTLYVLKRKKTSSTRSDFFYRGVVLLVDTNAMMIMVVNFSNRLKPYQTVHIMYATPYTPLCILSRRPMRP